MVHHFLHYDIDTDVAVEYTRYHYNSISLSIPTPIFAVKEAGNRTISPAGHLSFMEMHSSFTTSWYIL